MEFAWGKTLQAGINWGYALDSEITPDPGPLESDSAVYGYLDRLQDFFSNVNHLFVLSVGNTEGFADQGGGVVNIFRTRDQQKFEINLQRAIERGLFISSDLLSLARIINAD